MYHNDFNESSLDPKERSRSLSFRASFTWVGAECYVSARHLSGPWPLLHLYRIRRMRRMVWKQLVQGDRASKWPRRWQASIQLYILLLCCPESCGDPTPHSSVLCVCESALPVISPSGSAFFVGCLCLSSVTGSGFITSWIWSLLFSDGLEKHHSCKYDDKAISSL